MLTVGTQINRFLHRLVCIFLDVDSRMSDKSFGETKPRLPYVKRTRIQYTLQQVGIMIFMKIIYFVFL
jgi:hypothetical protein